MRVSPNPANGQQNVRAERTRIPMSLPTTKLAVPDIEGYHLHWMLGKARVQQALRAGYEFVDASEVDVVSTGLADSATADGNTDLGSRVSVSAGNDVGPDNEQQRLYLMKIKQEWWEEDQALLAAGNEQIAATLRGGAELGANPHGSDHRYVPQAHRNEVANLFTPKIRRP